MVFDRLRKDNLSINADKCKLEQSEHSSSTTNGGLRPLKSKVEALRNSAKPMIAKNLKNFLGMLNFYRPFLENATKRQGTSKFNKQQQKKLHQQ